MDLYCVLASIIITPQHIGDKLAKKFRIQLELSWNHCNSLTLNIWAGTMVLLPAYSDPPWVRVRGHRPNGWGQGFRPRSAKHGTLGDQRNREPWKICKTWNPGGSAKYGTLEVLLNMELWRVCKTWNPDGGSAKHGTLEDLQNMEPWRICKIWNLGRTANHGTLFER